MERMLAVCEGVACSSVLKEQHTADHCGAYDGQRGVCWLVMLSEKGGRCRLDHYKLPYAYAHGVSLPLMGLLPKNETRQRHLALARRQDQATVR